MNDLELVKLLERVIPSTVDLPPEELNGAAWNVLYARGGLPDHAREHLTGCGVVHEDIERVAVAVKAGYWDAVGFNPERQDHPPWDAQTIRTALSKLCLADAARELGFQDIGALLAAMRATGVEIPELDPAVARDLADRGREALEKIRRLPAGDQE